MIMRRVNLIMITTVQSVMYVDDNWVQCGLNGGLVCLQMTLSHYPHYADLSESILDACHVYSVECMPKLKSILSIIFDEIYCAVCFSLPISLLIDCESGCSSFCYRHHHHQIENIDH